MPRSSRYSPEVRAVKMVFEHRQDYPSEWATMSSIAHKWFYAFEWGERVRILGGDGRLGHVTPPAWSSTRNL